MTAFRDRLTPDLIGHYNRPGPRYTSYPTAPQMRESFPASTYREALAAGSIDRPLSLYFHLPFCKSLCLYCGCHMMVTNKPCVIERYLGYLMREIDMVSEVVNPERTVTHLHWGGGTPTFLSPDQMSRLIAHIRDRFRVTPDAEIGIEADPRTLTPAHVEAMRAGGFNRVSLGVQDLDPDVQKAIGRIQPETMVEGSLRMLREAGFDRISLDLIYGLPHQTDTSFGHTLERVIAMHPERLSLFSYAHVPWMKKHQRAIPTASLPSADSKMGLFLEAIEQLTTAGYRHVGMDHFALPDDPLCLAQDAGTLHRNFQGYATDAGCDLVGLGLSSISQLYAMYVQNEKGLNDYYLRIGNGALPIARGVSLTDDDVIRSHVIMRLMCDFAVDRRDVESRFEIAFDDYFAEALDELNGLEEHGLVEDDGIVLRVTDLGRLFIRNAAMAFDAYLPRGEGATAGRFSQTV